MFIFKSILMCLPLAFSQMPLYLRTPAVGAPVFAAAPIAQLQCSQQCMPSCLPSCLMTASPVINYQQYQQTVEQVVPQAVQPVATAPSPYYQAYGADLAYYPVVQSCAAACMPTCAPTCVSTTSPPNPQRDDLPTPPPETLPTPPPEVTTTTSSPTDVVPCKCLIKITVTQGNKVISKCGPNSCACPQGYNQCGSNCCKA